MKRRKFLQQSMVAGAGMMAGVRGGGVGRGGGDFPVVRIPEAKRKFRSQAVEKIIREVRSLGRSLRMRRMDLGTIR